MKTWASCWKVFWTSLLFSKYLGPLLDLPSFRVQMIRWDSMHIINLGVDLWICGSVIRKLLSYDLFGGLDLNEEDRLLIAYDSFKDWARKNKVQYLFCNWFIFLGFCQNFFNNNHKWYIYIYTYIWKHDKILSPLIKHYVSHLGTACQSFVPGASVANSTYIQNSRPRRTTWFVWIWH